MSWESSPPSRSKKGARRNGAAKPHALLQLEAMCLERSLLRTLWKSCILKRGSDTPAFVMLSQRGQRRSWDCLSTIIRNIVVQMVILRHRARYKYSDHEGAIEGWVDGHMESSTSKIYFSSALFDYTLFEGLQGGKDGDRALSYILGVV